MKDEAKHQSSLWQTRFFFKQHNAPPLSIVRGSDCYLYTNEGKAYLNAFSGLSLPFGLGRKELNDAIRGQLDKLSYSALSGISVDVTEEYAQRLSSFVPRGPWTALFCNSGSEAVDGGLKVVDLCRAIKRTKGKKTLVFSHSYHGQSLAAMAASGIYSFPNGGAAFGLCYAHSPVCSHCPFHQNNPGCSFPCLDDVQRLLETGEIDSLLIEPVIGAGGVYIIPDDYWQQLHKIVVRYKPIVIMDESATCGGRTGVSFAFESLPIDPDIVLVAKGINGGLLPIGAVLLSEAIAQDLLFHQMTLFGPSQSGNALCCAVGLATIDLFEKEKPWINAAVVGDFILSQLRDSTFWGKAGAEVRGRGLLIGVEVGSTGYKGCHGEKLRDVMCSKGALIYARGNFVGLFPPLSMTKASAEELISMLRQSCQECF